MENHNNSLKLGIDSNDELSQPPPPPPPSTTTTKPTFSSEQYIPRAIILEIVKEISESIPKFREKNYFFSHSSKKEESTIDRKSIQYHSNRILLKDLILNDKENKEKIIYKNSTITNNKNEKKEEEEEEEGQIKEVKEEQEEIETIHIWQPKVLKQRKNDSCGYYCLYNSLTILNSCFIGTEEEAKSIYSEYLESRVLFWHFYWVSIKLFLEKSKQKKKDKQSRYPWNEKCILKGVLERSYVEYMFKSGVNDNMNMISRQHYPITVLPDWAIQSLKNNRLPIDEIKEMERISQLFKSSSNYTHVFMIGQAIHWITIVINKVNNHSELIVLDSRNHNLLGATDDEVMQLVNKHPELSDHMRKSYLFSLIEPKLIVQILKDCMLGDADLTKTLLQLNLTCFLENFYSHVNNHNDNDNTLSIFNNLNINNNNNNNKTTNITTTTTTTTKTTSISSSSSSSNTITTTFTSSSSSSTSSSSSSSTSNITQQQQLIYWLENYWPPSVIEYNICQVLDSIITTKEDMDRYLECHILESLSVWIKSTSDHLKNHSDVKLIQRFSVTMNWFDKKFLNFQ
ncbi:hypothetical protein ACTFIR_001408 [Dictyostelium discoideum]